MTDTTPSFPSPPGCCKAAASGFGYLAFAGLATWAAERERPTAGRAARPEAAALPGPGQAGHLPVHARRAVARRHVRLQAEAHGRRRQAVRRRAGSPAAKLLGSPWKFRQHGQSGLWISRAVPGRRQARRRPVRRSTACTPTCRTTRRRSCSCTPAASSSRRPSARGVDPLRPGDRERRTCPGFITISPPANNGGAGELRQSRSCRPSTRGRRIGVQRPARSPTATIVSNLNNPRQSSRPPSGSSSTSSRRSTARPSSASRSTRRSRG